MNPHPGLHLRSICIALSLFFSAHARADVPRLKIQTGHPSGVGSISFSPDGRALASGGRNGFIKIWETATRRELLTWAANTGGIWSLAFSPDGKTLASGGEDNLVRLWEPATGSPLGVLAGHSGFVTALIFADDGKTLVTGSSDNTIKVWDLAARRELRTLKGHTGNIASLSVSPDGRTLASTGYEKIIRLWDLGSGRELRPLGGHREAVTSAVFSPRGRLLASAGVDQTVRLWDADSGLELRTMREQFKTFSSVAFSPDGRVLATAYSGFSRVINGQSDQDGVTLKLWDVETGRELHAMKGPPVTRSVAFSRDGQTVASGGMVAHIQLWSVATGREVGKLRGIANIYRTFALSPDGRRLASGSSSTFVAPRVTNEYAEGDGRGGTIKLWDLSTGELIQTLRGHAAPVSRIIFSGDGRFLATAAAAELKIWDAATGRELRTLKGARHGLRPVTFDGSGRRVVTEGGDQVIRLWDVETGRELLRTKSDGSGTTIIAADAEGRRIAVRDGERNIKILSAESGRVSKTLKGHEGPITSLAFAHEGDVLASSSRDKTVKLWDVRRGVELFTLGGHPAGVGAVVFGKDDEVLLSRAGKEVKFWDPASGKELRTLAADCGGVETLSLGPGGRTLTCGGNGSDINLFDIETGKELATVVPVDRQDWIAVTPEGLFDSSHTAFNYLSWRFSESLYDVASAETFFSEFYYPGLLGEVFAGRPLKAPSEIGRKDRRQPRLKLTAPDSPRLDSVAARNIRVSVEVEAAAPDAEHARPAGARDVRLFRNGSLVKVWRGDVLEGKERASLDATVAVTAGENRLTAYAFNDDNVKSEDAALSVTGADSLRRAGTLYVVAVGVNEYSNPHFNLKLAAPDATLFGEQLAHAQRRIGRFGGVEVIPLLDRDATKSNILQALGRLAGAESRAAGAETRAAGAQPPDALKRLRPAQPEDAVFVYFAGHGMAHGSRFYLVPHDFGYGGGREPAEVEASLPSILKRSVSDLELESAFEQVDAGQLVLIIDACNSGQALEGGERRRGPMNSQGLAQLAYEKGMYILTAAQSYQEALASSALGHGYLTYALAEEGLRTDAADEAPKDGRVLLREWLNYAAERVPQMQREEAREGREGRRGREIRYAGVQVPRVFYRREDDAEDFVVGVP